ncbi:MAG: rod shape-determining protein [Clostridia bacterium]|nr:rod shape-determining protein [Clostridia bacterium]
MTKYNVTLTIGSAYCALAGKHADFYIKEPSVVAKDNVDGTIKGCGNHALRLVASGMANVKIVNPILEGTISDAEGAKELFRTLFAKLLPQKAQLFPDTKVVAVVPCALNTSDKTQIENVLLQIGVKSVSFVETPLADSVELFRQFRTNRGIVMDLGSDCADFAVVYGDQIVAGATVYLGGKALTQAIRQKVREKYLLQLSSAEAEKLKVKCASLYSNDTSSCTVYGSNFETGENEKVTITSKELFDTTQDFCNNYVKIIYSLINSIPDEMVNLIKQEGVMVCGGTGLLEGLENYLHNQLDMVVRLADNCKNTTIEGAKQMLN